MQNNSGDVKKIDTIKVSDSAATIRADAMRMWKDLEKPFEKNLKSLRKTLIILKSKSMHMQHIWMRW